MDHSQMNHHAHMDHSQMNHGTVDHSQMDHSKMDHGQMDHGQVDHSQMDHSKMGHHSAMDGMDHMMKMYFHGGCTEVILFDFWRIDSVGGLVGSMAVVFLLATAYEGIKFAREFLLKRYFTPVRAYNAIASSNNEAAAAVTSDSAAEAQESASAVGATSIKTVETSMTSIGHLVLTLIHVVQVTLAYLLMLVFMTYNTWLCAAVVLGFGFGYFLFGWRKTVLLDEPDHCH